MAQIVLAEGGIGFERGEETAPELAQEGPFILVLAEGGELIEQGFSPLGAEIGGLDTPASRLARGSFGGAGTAARFLGKGPLQAGRAHFEREILSGHGQKGAGIGQGLAFVFHPGREEIAVLGGSGDARKEEDRREGEAEHVSRPGREEPADPSARR